MVIMPRAPTAPPDPGRHALVPGAPVPGLQSRSGAGTLRALLPRRAVLLAGAAGHGRRRRADAAVPARLPAARAPMPVPQLRARAAALVVAPAIRQRVVAGRMTAAWIYGCAAEPDRLALLVDANRRISSLRSVRGCTFHEVRLGPFDVVSMGGLMVSSPLRTAVDIALHVDAERAVPALQGAPGPARAGRAAAAAQARRGGQPARAAQAGGPGEARRPRGRAGGAR